MHIFVESLERNSKWQRFIHETYSATKQSFSILIFCVNHNILSTILDLPNRLILDDQHHVNADERKMRKQSSTFN